jgi:Tat protein translocase TatB subunit
MFGIGMPELVVVLVVALIVLGPKRLPEVARSLGRALSEFRHQSTELMDDLKMQIEDDPKPKRPTPPDDKPESRDV